MNRLALLVICFVAISPLAHAERVVMSCFLNGPQAAPPIVTPAFGCGRFIVDTSANTIEYRLCMTGLIGNETAAIIHGPAEPGIATAEHLFTLPMGPVKSGVLLYDEADEAMILSGSTYVNIHTSAFPLDEIRGQIVHLNCILDGDQASVATTGSGWGGFTIDTEANTLSYYLEFESLEGVETMAHIHGPARHDETGGILHTFPIGSPKVGVWNYDESLEPAILDGRIYANIHSSLHPSGEIRGQISPHLSPLDRDQVVTPSTSNAAGYALLAIDTDADTLSYAIRMAGLEGTENAPVIHGFAPPGQGGPAIETIALGEVKVGAWSYDPGQEAEVLDSLAYIDIHTAAFPDGELRGQFWLGAPTVEFVRGDANGDGGVDIGDAVSILGILFSGTPNFCPDATDTNDDGAANIADAVFLLNRLFTMGPEIAPPNDLCGNDPTDDALSCGAFDGC